MIPHVYGTCFSSITPWHLIEIYGYNNIVLVSLFLTLRLRLFLKHMELHYTSLKLKPGSRHEASLLEHVVDLNGMGDVKHAGGSLWFGIFRRWASGSISG